MTLARRLEVFYFCTIDNYVQYMNSYTGLLNIVKSKIPLNMRPGFLPAHEYVQFKRFIHSNKNLHNLKFELASTNKSLFIILDSVSKFFEKVKFVHSKFEIGSSNCFQKKLMNNYILLDTFYYDSKKRIFFYNKNLNFKPLYYNFSTLLESQVLNDLIQVMYPKFLSTDNTFKFFYVPGEGVPIPKSVVPVDPKLKMATLTKAGPFNVSELEGFKLRKIIPSTRYTYYLNLYEKRLNFKKVNII